MFHHRTRRGNVPPRIGDNQIQSIHEKYYLSHRIRVGGDSENDFPQGGVRFEDENGAVLFSCVSAPSQLRNSTNDRARSTRRSPN
jgi:hypothetical protein